MNDEPIRECPECGEARVRRLISAAAGLIFKGTGFYLTDYARKDQRSSSGTDRSNGKPAKGDTEAKTSSAKSAETTKENN